MSQQQEIVPSNALNTGTCNSYWIMSGIMDWTFSIRKYNLQTCKCIPRNLWNAGKFVLRPTDMNALLGFMGKTGFLCQHK